MIIVKDKGIREKLIAAVKEKESFSEKTQLREPKDNKIELLKEAQFPNARDEDWRYADLDFLLGGYFEKKQPKKIHQSSRIKIDEIKSEFKESSFLILIDGLFTESESLLKADENSKISITHGKETEGSHKPLFKNQENQFFYYLNQTNPDSDVHIKLTGDLNPKAPLHVIHVEGERKSKKVPIYQPAINIFLEKNSHFEIIEHFIGDSKASSFSNGVTNIILEQDSSLSYQKIQNINFASQWLSNTFIYQSAGSQLTHGSYQFGSSWARNSTQVMYSGKNTHTSLYGVSIGKNDQFLDQSIKINHNYPNAESEQLFKFVLGDKSRGVFNGKILVQPGASNLVAQQSNHNLLLTDQAEMNSKPQLEILNQDVKCSHGSTIGKLDEKSLFYLQARGINREKAKKILTEAFVMQVVEKVAQESTRTYLEHIIRNNLD